MEVERWYFTPEELEHTPSRKCGISAEKELSYRQQSAKLIQDMGQRLQLNQLAINTAIVYMHRFYMYHNFSKFHRHAIAPASLFLAAKVEEQPRKLEHVIKIASFFITHDHQSIDIHSDAYAEKAQELVMNENILLQALGFDVAIDHPHTYVVKCFQMVRALTNLPQTSYFMATNSLHMTTMCLQYKPAVVACVCIDIVCRWGNYEIQSYTEGKDWFVIVDPTVTTELLEKLSAEFITVLDKFPNRLKKFKSMNAIQHGVPTSIDYRPPRHSSSLSIARTASSSSSRNHESNSKEAGSCKSQHASSSSQAKTVLSHKEYTEKREKERRERERHAAQISASSHPVNSSSQRAHMDQLRMPPPQVPVGRNQPSHNRDTHPRKDQIPGEKHERVSDNNDSAKCHEKICDNRDSVKCNEKVSENHESVKNHDKIIDNNEKISKNYDIAKVHERTKHPPVKPKVEIKPVKQETNVKLEPSPSLSNINLSTKEGQPPTESNLGVGLSTALTSAMIKKSLASNSISQNSKAKSVNNNIPISLYHPRLDGKTKPTKDTSASLPPPSGVEQHTVGLVKPEKYTSKDDVTTISSISKLISQSMTKPQKQESYLEPAANSSTNSHSSRKRKSEHSHKHDKDKKRKKSKHKSKDKKEKHKDKESKDHKKSKKQKKHKEKDKEREKDAKQKSTKSNFDINNEVDSVSNTPIKLTIIRDKGVYTPEASQIPTKANSLISDVTYNNSATPSSAAVGGLKITIPKSRLQTNTPQPSPPRGIPPRENYTPNVKLKISKEKLKSDKESRKRERSPQMSQTQNKYLRTSGGINLQKVLDCATWSSQGP